MRAPSLAASLLLPALLLGACAAHVAAQESGHRHPDHADQPVSGGGTISAGWSARADENAGTANVKVVPMGKGIHVSLGPAIILYRDDTKGTGPFHTLATFTQTKATTHAEGYGLFYGGQGLDGAGEKYTYFLVRQDGTYLVKQREGDKTTEITKGWVASPAVHKIEGKGSSTNLLEIDHKRDPAKVVFMVNGQGVYTLDAKATNTDGVVGMRVNHNLDLHVDGFGVHR
jgi:hypothetical protein